MNAPDGLMPTGIPGLDQLLEGGIVRGNSLLLEGPPGSGKSTLGVRILHEGVVRYDEPGLLITFEEFPRQVYAEALGCGVDLRKLEEAGKFRVVWTPPSRILESFHGKNDLVEKIVEEIGVRRLLIDSITHFKRISSDEGSLREILSSILTHLKLAGVNAILVKELARQDNDSIAFEEYLVDASLRLHNMRAGTFSANTRYVEVRKTRGQGHVSGFHPFHLDDNGFRVFPRLRSKDLKNFSAPARPPARKRVAFGVEALDAMLCGGLRPGTSSVVVGYAGCGKSVLSNHFLDEGLRRGGRVMLLSLKGDAHKIVSDARSLGMEWRPAFESGQLRVMHFYPFGLSIEEVVDHLAHEIRVSAPDRFVCDSVDTLAYVARGNDHLRDHLLVMTDILHAAGATTLLLQDARRMGGETDDDLHWLAHLTACSINFSMAEIEGTLRRFIAVMKHAGSGHTKELREIHIDGRGLHVQRTTAGLSGILTGQGHRALKTLSEDVLPALGNVDQTLNQMVSRAGASRALADDVRKAKRQVALVGTRLREYLGGIDFAQSAATPSTPQEKFSERARILLVEDNVTNQQVALAILGKLGLTADAVSNGAEAIESLTSKGYDLVLMDVEMPVMDGFEATARIRNPQTGVRNQGVPIIAMTARAMQGDRDKCLQAGMNDYLSKPFAPPALVALLEKWLPDT